MDAKIIEDIKKKLEDIEHSIDMLAEMVKTENPISTKCEVILREPLTKDRCYDFRAIRQWVMCKTWDIMEKEHIRFADAIKKAWEEAKIQCLAVGARI